MSVSHLDITRRAEYPFDYERIDGLLHFAVDPSNPANQRIVDLDKAPRNAQGQVEFTSDFVLLQPRQAEQANRRLLFYVVNRGQRVGVPFSRVPARDATLPPTDEIDPGDGFLMRHGWTVVMGRSGRRHPLAERAGCTRRGRSAFEWPAPTRC